MHIVDSATNSCKWQNSKQQNQADNLSLDNHLDSNGLEARLSTSRCEASACIQSRLGLICCAAVQAALLAPAKEACGLAILGCVLTIGCVALGASSTNAQLASEAIVELVMVEVACQHVVCSETTVRASLANSGTVSQCSLLVSTAGTSHGRLEARSCTARCEASACNVLT